MSFGKYRFYPWARRGISSQIIENDNLGKAEGSAEERASIEIKVRLNTGSEEDKKFSLFGPGDITGISENMIIRTEPRNGIADFEPNYLPYIEFYDEDFPFRYTPASPANESKHLRPWLALIVLKENEFLDTKRREPLASIRIVSKDVLPPQDQLHLWAHMHSNLPHEESDFDVFLDNLEEDVKTDPDGVYSRLICPRKLEAKALYHAFLVPAFETGRLAGLGQSTKGIKAQKSSFSAADNEFPVYYRWYFRTGLNFDFEYMVKLLKPRPMDERVGVREMDCSRPAFIRANKKSEVRPPKPKVLLLEGALLAPDAKRRSLDRGPQPFSNDMEKLVNLNRSRQENPHQDPFVSVPYYGMHHAMRRNSREPGKLAIAPFDPSSRNWYNELNHDPVYRVPAGFGKRVVQENQDKFMNQAWKQLGDVLAANRKMKLARFASEAMGKVYRKTLAKQAGESFLAVTSALNSRVRDGDVTVRATLRNSLVADANFEPAFRRMTRRSTSLVRGLDQRNSAGEYSFDLMFRKENMANGLSAEVSEKFPVVGALEHVSGFESPTSVANVHAWSTQSNLQKDYAFNLPGYAGGLPDVVLWGSTFPPSSIAIVAEATPPAAGAAVIRPLTVTPGLVPQAVAGTSATRRPAAGTVTATRGPMLAPGTVLVPVITSPAPTTTISEVALIDTTIADQRLTARQHSTQVKAVFQEVSARFAFEKTETPAPPVATTKVKETLRKAISPEYSYKRWVDARIHFPEGTRMKPKEEFVTAMAYPDIPVPAYQYLIDIDKEFLLPNLDLIENNTLSLLKTNQKFIEAYLVGLNYEMGRELLWREYPTDMRGSYFRQFWDTSGFVTPDTTPEDADSMKDIRPIDQWSRMDRLGAHNAREPDADPEQLVFVIRGDLLKKYPNTVIYAQKAIRNKDSGNKEIRTEFSADESNREIRFPLYQAEIAPDIKLLGFDLTVNEATGEDRTKGFNDKHGWFFVIAEVPGEPRFGMDLTSAVNRPGDTDWNDLSWKHFDDQLKFIRSDVQPTLPIPPDSSGKWGESSSDMATILLQRPVMVAIHATEMLNRKIESELFVGRPVTLRSHISEINPQLLDT